jgi:deoxyribose-phosphate aldolase
LKSDGKPLSKELNMEHEMESEKTPVDLAAVIDHTFLKMIATETAVVELCREAKKYGFASVCVNPCNISTCVRELAGSEVKVSTVVGYPLGATTSETKTFEARQAVALGAAEIDMVINIGKAKAGDWTSVEMEITTVVTAVVPAIVKVIIETCYLSAEEKVKACLAAKAAGAKFVQTSTGFGTGGATAEDVALMRAAVDASVKIKASGGIRTRTDAMAMLNAGAERIGASAGVAIVVGNED